MPTKKLPVPELELLGIIASRITSRNSLTIEFQRKLQQLDDYDRNYKERILLQLPKTIRDWVSQNEVMDRLFETGIAQETIGLGKEPFKDGLQARKQVDFLQKYLKGIVETKAEYIGTQVKITFKVVF